MKKRTRNMTRISKSLMSQFVFWVVLIILAFAAVLPELISILLTRAYDQQSKLDTIQMSEAISKTVTAFVDGAYCLVQELSYNPLITSMDGELQTPIITDIIGRSDYLELLYIQDMNGDQTARTSGELTNRKDRWWFKQMVEQRQPFVSETYYSVYSMMPCTSIFMPIYEDGSDSEMIGIFGANIKLSYIQGLVDKFSDYKNGKYSFIIDGNGVIMAHPDNSYMQQLANVKDLTLTVSIKDEQGHPVYEPGGNNVATETISFTLSEEYSNSIRKVMDGEIGNGMVEMGGETFYVGYAPITLPGESVPWSVLTLNTEEAAMTVVRQIIFNILMVTFMFLLLFLAAFIVLARRLSKPINEIAESAYRIASGDYTARVLGKYSSTEFAIVTKAINAMALNIQESINETNRSLNMFTSILNGLDAMIYVVVPDTGEILFVNEKTKRSYGITSGGTGDVCYQLFNNRSEQCENCVRQRLLANPDFPVVWEDHNPLIKRTFRKTGSLIDWPGRGKAYLQHCADITDIETAIYEKNKAQQEAEILKHKKEQAEETSRTKSNFLANMSHEIRTPMNGIIGFTELALDDDISSATKSYLTKIKVSADSLLGIINDILDISKIEAGKVKLEQIPFDVNEVIQLCRTITSPKATEKGITLFCYSEPTVGRLLIGDPTRLQQILLNLLSNAVKFTDNGMVKLMSDVVATDDNSVTIHFEVKDDGIGMSEELISRVLSPFVQADDSTARRYGGTGLGLSITNNLLELMGSRLYIDSKLGKGSVFSFDLTFKTVDMETEHPYLKDTTEPTARPVFEGEVLVCEDNELNQQVICDHLSRVGLASVIAGNGKEGVDIVQHRMSENAKPFDLIFMDIHMPEMDGLETAKVLAEMGCKTPIVAFTANIMANDRQQYKKVGMSDCLSKPFSTRELWVCLLKYLIPAGTFAKSGEPSEDERNHMTLVASFVKGNQTTIADIKSALLSQDITLAHRLAHTLKGTAGLIGMTALQNIAQTVERALAGGKSDVTAEQLTALEFELKIVLDEYAHLSHGRRIPQPSEGFDVQKALALLDSLQELLDIDSFDCLNLVPELGKIPGFASLADQVENFNFKQARETLDQLRGKLRNQDGQQL